MSAKVIYDHTDIARLQDLLDAEPYFRCGAPPCNRPSWVDQPAALEVPLGELCDSDPVTSLGGLVAMQKGMGSIIVETGPITGKEGFNAQGLEGKAIIHTTLFDAFLKLRDYCRPNRARIVV